MVRASGTAASPRRGRRPAVLAGVAVLAASPLLLSACSGGSPDKVAVAATGAPQQSLGAAVFTGGAPSPTRSAKAPKATKATKRASARATPSAASRSAAAVSSTPGVTYPGCTAPTPASWGEPVRSDSFSATTTTPSGWNVYNAPTGDPPRLTSQVKEAGGSIQLIGTTVGGKSVSGGASDAFAQKYGRWEACMRTDKGRGYLPAITLWPDNNNWPTDGEIDIVESVDGQRRQNIHFVHNNAGNDRRGIRFTLDISRWNLFAVDWTPNSVVFSVDGVRQWTMSTRSLVPFREKMHMTLQLDAMNKPGCRDGCRDASTPKHPTMYVTWMKAFKYRGQKN